MVIWSLPAKKDLEQIFDYIAIQNFTYEQTAKQLGFTKRQIKYKYGLIVRQILDFLNKRGVKDLEDLL